MIILRSGRTTHYFASFCLNTGILNLFSTCRSMEYNPFLIILRSGIKPILLICRSGFLNQLLNCFYNRGLLPISFDNAIRHQEFKPLFYVVFTTRGFRPISFWRFLAWNFNRFRMELYASSGKVHTIFLDFTHFKIKLFFFLQKALYNSFSF